MTKGYYADLSACGLYHLVMKKGCGDTVCSRHTVISSLVRVLSLFFYSFYLSNGRKNPPSASHYD